jgi:transposase
LWDDEQLVFLDETASNERTGDRKKGWSPIGIECTVDKPIKRSERWSILPALSNEGYIDWIIYQGSITADLFLEFLQEKILPQCEPFPGKRSVLIMDNASIHKNVLIKTACDEAGVLLQFLPPYSPDFNPIESTFKDLKAWIKANYITALEFESFLEFLEFAIQQVCRREVRGHFRACGYVVHSQ